MNPLSVHLIFFCDIFLDWEKQMCTNAHTHVHEKPLAMLKRRTNYAIQANKQPVSRQAAHVTDLLSLEKAITQFDEI